MKAVGFFGAMAMFAVAAFLAGRSQLDVGRSLCDAGLLGPTSEATKAFHHESREISERYQVHEIDEVVWRKETAEAAARLDAASSAAGAAWHRQIAAGHRAEQVGLFPHVAGVLAIGIGVVGAVAIRRAS